MIDIAHVRAHHETVVAGDTVALDDLGRLLRLARDVGDLAWRRPDPDDRAERVAERARVEVGVVAADDPVALEAREPLGHRR